MVASDIYEVPIEIRALGTASVYLVRTDQNKFLVDSGMRPSTCGELERMGADLRGLDAILITHMHLDHLGGAMEIKRKYGAEIIMGKEDALLTEMIGEDHLGFLNMLKSLCKSNGVPESVLGQLMRDHPMHREYTRYSEMEIDHKVDTPQSLLNDSSLKALITPGHSPGSISPYLDSGEIFVGDLVLKTITPNISFYDDAADTLSTYLQTLQMVKKYNFTRSNPGHGKPFDNLNNRISEIELHHGKRLEEVLGIVRENYRNAFEITLAMKWSRGRSFDSMNDLERNFAFGEAVSHIRKLANDGLVETSERNGIKYYRAS
ncbi:MAG: MBL fold metallo-hydrolase [Candidatus Thermoplasmatota archaeon]|jgi:glyoxylase-like metal-dependent hydrolase (beta-lactamase superfamily II)|nr:MBL fold metallo-hydrolase [Candidatus Thermoplasmatota archaeon]MCL5785825.1 MBL fold metallo-hydrolase [Candidatus Thermoplasmatota archaeon]